MERGREARTSGQVDVVFGIGQWLGCLRQQGINGGGGLDESASHHDPTKEWLYSISTTDLNHYEFPGVRMESH